MRGPRRPHPFPTRRSSDFRKQRARHLFLEHLVEGWVRKFFRNRLHEVRSLIVRHARALEEFASAVQRSEEHTSSHVNLVCRLLLEKKNRRSTSPVLVLHTP